MVVKRGRNAYQYQSSRVNGEVKTVYQRKVSAEEFRACALQKEKKQQQRNREEELNQINQAVDQVLEALDMMKRAHLLTIGLYQRRSEIRKLQENARCHTTMN